MTIRHGSFCPALQECCLFIYLFLIIFLTGTARAKDDPTTWTGEFAAVNGELSKWKTHSWLGWRDRARLRGNWIGGVAGNQTTQDASGVVLTGALATVVLGAVVVASNVTGEIGFLANGSSAPAGYSIISAYVKSVSTDTNGVLLFATI